MGVQSLRGYKKSVYRKDRKPIRTTARRVPVKDKVQPVCKESVPQFFFGPMGVVGRASKDRKAARGK